MFSVRYWCQRFFTGRYWPKFGGTAPALSGADLTIGDELVTTLFVQDAAVTDLTIQDVLLVVAP